MLAPVRIQEFEPPLQKGDDHAFASIREFVGLLVLDGPEALPVPREFTLGSLRDGRLRVVEPIEVVQTAEDGKCVVETPELNEFGFGDNPSEAIADLQAAIAELYFTLNNEKDRLGPDLAAVWTTLSRKLRRADAARRS